ncbi:phosphate ABC transporter substrate-binding protein [Dubosiella newyorkensis]|uniref:phosphate ABC transporter substrate-binding protein n=1 Tax=Dubosiella newyorkensis TaxID=1862672 RepID=UPI00259CB6C7|nr:phosphate ABC transporter substrate-binding protein [Dubosiella newyorkensis]
MKKPATMIGLCTLILFSGCSNSKKENVSLNGSTSMEKLVGTLSEVYQKENPETDITYDPTGSGAGIQAVEEDRCDIGLSSRYLKEEEKEAGLKETIVALDGIAVIVNPENPISDLSLEQVADIFTGKITNWKELGGNDQEIVLIGREAGSGTRDGFETITKTEENCQYRQELTSTGDVITTVSSNPSAIGYASLEALGDSVKALSINGVPCDVQSIQDQKYALVRPFIYVTKKELEGASKQFYDFSTSQKAVPYIEQVGLVIYENH